MQFASEWKRACTREVLDVQSDLNVGGLFQFSGPTCLLILAAREYFVLSPSRKRTSAPSDSMMEVCDDKDEVPPVLAQAVGSRVESNIESPNEWKVYTIAGIDTATKGMDGSACFFLVSSDSRVLKGVPTENIRSQSSRMSSHEDSGRGRRAGGSTRDDRSGLSLLLMSRQRSDTSSESSSTSWVQASALKRSWSAIGLVDDMHPVDLQVVQDDARCRTQDVTQNVYIRCSLDESTFVIHADTSRLETPPEIRLSLCSQEKTLGIDVSDKMDETLVWALCAISKHQGKEMELHSCGPFPLFFSLQINTSRLTFPPDFLSCKVPAKDSPDSDAWIEPNVSRARKLSARSLSNEDADSEQSLCDGFNSTSVKCMEVLNVFAECAEIPASSSARDGPKLPGFANSTLSKKLADQLDDPVRVIGGALPDWCLKGPSFAPCVFNYETRRSLLERGAFGVSRSTLKQQEAKVNVQRFRLRMASLRSKAVELVGEAFSGGAEDPTALQLQADELYGMEEALAMKVRAAFRAQNWQEHSLQVAKVAVRREHLILDATALMEKYSTDHKIRMRRLEVRFAGESGFDAASGDEAGVTRGFYADCAEALLSADNVAGAYCPMLCSSSGSDPEKISQATPFDDQLAESEKLPLFIPDMDDSNQVVIPTPRANKRSGPGVFPRPLPHYHPQHLGVLRKFRLMGRLFAAAMRDGFMFPLPLSSSFLKLVQRCDDYDGKWETHTDMILSVDDLPRPGFLGGEVYAAEAFICRALDDLDNADPPLSRVQLMRRCEELSNDKDFARKALGKNYDCSFNQYFQDKSFVDPLDPGQGADAAPLCPKGSSKPVTIYNIREWVSLAKRFILQDGIISQAREFRKGIQDFFSPEYLSLFTPEELQNDVCGIGDQVENWDEAAIRKLFKLDGESKIIMFTVEVC